MAEEPVARPLLLAVETATRVMSVALLDGDRLLAEITSEAFGKNGAGPGARPLTRSSGSVPST